MWHLLMEHMYHVNSLLLPLLSKTNVLKSSVVSLGLILLGFFNVASAAVDIPGSQDLTVFDRYTLSSIVEYDVRNVPEYALSTGRIKKVNGVISPESQRFLSGNLTKITYQIPSGHDTKSVADFVQSELEKRHAKILFQCDARNCGDSNDWANQVFGMQRLYGLTGKQFYWAATVEADNAGAQYTMAIYLTQRGTRQVFLHIEALQSEAPMTALTAEEMLTRWKIGERVFVLSDDIKNNGIDELTQAVQQVLEERPFSKVWLVGHQGGTSPFQILLRDSEQAAQMLRQMLIDLGLPENRLFAKGIGPLAPMDTSVPKNRIEILVE